MSPASRSIMICDDNIDHLMLMKRELERFSSDFRVTTVTTAQVCLEELARSHHDVVVIDYLLRDMNGLDLLREISTRHPESMPVMITGMGSEDVAVQAMKAGASDYIIKSTGSFAVVPLVIARALERKSLLASKRALESQAERVSQINVLGALALGVAHDVNELLATILGRAQLLGERLADADQRSQTEVIARAASDAAAIVGRILEFAGGKARAQRESVRLAEAVSACLEFTRSRWESEARRRGVSYQIHNEVPGELAIDVPPAALREVVTNLIINSLEAMPEGGTLLLRAMADQRLAHLYVQDTGTGMTRETMAQLFEPFHTAGKPSGRGIGLATCRAIVEELGGSIQVESELDVGTTFEVSLPLRAGDAVAPPPATTPAGEAAGLRILVVDNEPRIAGLMQDILAADGHLPALAHSGEEAMSKFQEGAFDIMFCDISMPGLSGLEVARAVRALDPRLAIVLISGWGNERLDAAQMDGIVDLSAVKPLDIDRIRELVSAAGALAAARKSDPGGPAAGQG